MTTRYYEYYPPSSPKAAKGGIKAQSKRGRFAENWWAKRWLAVLESFNIGARLGRGRTYARKGQVLSIEIDKGTVKAKVQGSRSKPYAVTIKVKSLSAAGWRKLTKALSKQALFAAKLLAGEMPQDIELAFKKVGLSLFPQKLKDLETACSCPDWSNPCKHIAAVYYLLGEAFDQNPFLIFTLRGMDREELLAGLGQTNQNQDNVEAQEGEHAMQVAQGSFSPSEPILQDIKAFWSGNDVPEDFFGEILVPPVKAAQVKRLGKFPFWRGRQPLLDILEPIYAQASQSGMSVFLGEAAITRAQKE